MYIYWTICHKSHKKWHGRIIKWTFKLHHSKKLEEQIFDIRFFSMIRILDIWVLSGEIGVPAWLRTMYCDLLKFHLARLKYLVFLPDWKILRQKFVPLTFWSSVYWPNLCNKWGPFLFMLLCQLTDSIIAAILSQIQGSYIPLFYDGFV